VEKTVAGTADKVTDAIKVGGATAKRAAAKVHEVATDPVVQEKARKLAEIGAKVYRMANSPEAKKAYRQVAALLNRTGKK
jgi:AICAR transformylase/IMP cyclohydrolase PurH